jgi:hypothetical protein
MESVVLLDCERIRALGNFPTFQKEGDKVCWDENDCAFKFLVIDGWLVIGAVGDHLDLYATYSFGDQPVDEETPDKIYAIKRAAHRQVYSSRGKNPVSGAGKIGADGRITGWKSENFNVETPAGMRAEIEQEVARLFQAGKLTP